ELNVLCSKKPILPDIYTLSLHDALPIFCNSAIDLIVRNDKGGHFKVGALQDEKAKAILKDYDIEDDYLDPIILVRGNSVFYKSRASLEISRKMRGAWPLLYSFILIPSIIRYLISVW